MNELSSDPPLQLQKIKDISIIISSLFILFQFRQSEPFKPFQSIIGIVAATEIEECKLCLKKRLSTPNDVKIRALQDFSRGV